MFRVEAIIDTDVIEAQRDLIENIAPEFGLAMRNEVVPLVTKKVQQTIAVYPPAVKHPFEFATDKSRRAYFATQGFGHGIPYQRTKTLYNSWKVELDRRMNEGFIQIKNTAPYAGYVYGSGSTEGSYEQVPGHRNTGWGRDMDNQVLDLSEYTQNLIIDLWYKVLSGVYNAGESKE